MSVGEADSHRSVQVVSIVRIIICILYCFLAHLHVFPRWTCSLQITVPFLSKVRCPSPRITNQQDAAVPGSWCRQCLNAVNGLQQHLIDMGYSNQHMLKKVTTSKPNRMLPKNTPERQK
jgi:hypothetical protein